MAVTAGVVLTTATKDAKGVSALLGGCFNIRLVIVGADTIVTLLPLMVFGVAATTGTRVLHKV